MTKWKRTETAYSGAAGLSGESGGMAPAASPNRRKLPRDCSWEDYGITKERYRELCAGCRNGKYPQETAAAAHKAAPFIEEYLLLSVTKKKTYERVEFDDRLGRIPCGRTDFYGYRRLLYHYLEEALREGREEQKDLGRPADGAPGKEEAGQYGDRPQRDCGRGAPGGG